MNDKTYSTNRTIEIIHPERFFKSYQEYLEGKRHVAELKSGDFMIRAYETFPLKGFEQPANFPNCCQWHAKILEQSREKLDIFPGCCEPHKKLVGEPWFDKMDYAYMPEKVLNTIVYTIHSIKECSSHENWFKEITDYITYSKDSYGQLPFGYGSPLGQNQYLSCLESNIPNMEELSDAQADQLIEFVDSLLSTGSEKRSPDLNQLIGIYKQWLKLFPFNVSYLSHLKHHYQQKLPILRGPGETNLYTGQSAVKLVTKKELIKFLKDTTVGIITKVNALEAFKKGLLTNKSETNIELLNARRQLELESLTLNGRDTEHGYLKMLKKWLKQERDYIKELTNCLNNDYSTETFILNILDGMKLLQSGDTNQSCLMSIRQNGKDKESGVRYWFKDFLSARYKGAIVTAEEENGPGKMDLKIYHEQLKTKVIEFKGWWNNDKSGAITQVINYLTDFESDGFVFMINHLKNKDITDDYQQLVEQKNTDYVDGSWLKIPVPHADLDYFSSKHMSTIKTKMIYHFIFNVNF